MSKQKRSGKANAHDCKLKGVELLNQKEDVLEGSNWEIDTKSIK